MRTEITINVSVVYIERDVMILMQEILNEGHWKGWALRYKNETFLDPEMATSEASAFWA